MDFPSPCSKLISDEEMVSCLTFTRLRAKSTDNNLMIFFSSENRVRHFMQTELSKYVFSKGFLKQIRKYFKIAFLINSQSAANRMIGTRTLHVADLYWGADGPFSRITSLRSSSLITYIGIFHDLDTSSPLHSLELQNNLSPIRHLCAQLLDNCR